MVLLSTDPVTGIATGTELSPTTQVRTDDIIAVASRVSQRMEAVGRNPRADMLAEIAREIGSQRQLLVSAARAETGLSTDRLDAELTRSIGQFQLFAEAIQEGGYLEATIDHGDVGSMGQPDLRRMLRPVGVVGVFGASNFPFAFSVLGGDTASALAAGCAVVVKAHSGHPVTSDLSYRAIARAAAATGLADAVQLVYGRDAGARLVTHPEVKAVAFTGSLRGGRALMQLIDSRPDPIPFYGELSSINPVVVTRGAAAERSNEIAEGLFASVTGSGGQLCTKPGVVFLPSGVGGSAIASTLGNLFSAAAPAVLLTGATAEDFMRNSQAVKDAGARETATGTSSTLAGFHANPTLLETTSRELNEEMLRECFGPLLLLVEYHSLEDVRRGIRSTPPSLAGSIHSLPSENDARALLAHELTPRVGRLIFDGYPTGVRVSWAQHHGGPWPSTNTIHTSVGVTAIRRFLRPFCWQNAPLDQLPSELRDGEPLVPVRVDGRLRLPQTV